MYLDLAAPRWLNPKYGEHGCSKTPGPQALAILLMPRLVNIQPVLLGKQVMQLVVAGFQAVTDLGAQLAKLSPADRDSNHVTQELPDAGKRTMAGGFEVSNQGGQPRSDQSGPTDIIRDGLGERSSTATAPACHDAVFVHFYRTLDEFDLLQDTCRLGLQLQLPLAARALFKCVDLNEIDLRGSECLTLKSRMTGLPASLEFPFAASLELLHDIAGRWLRRGARILLQPSQFGDHSGKLGLKLLHLLT